MSANHMSSALPTIREIDSKLGALDGLSEEEMQEVNRTLAFELDKKDIARDLLRGHYSVRFLKDKYPKYGADEIKRIVKEIYDEIASLEIIDLRIEMLGYLASSTDFQVSLYDMLEAARDPKMRLEIIKLLNQLKLERLQFIERIGMTLQNTGEAPQDLKGLVNADYKHLEQRRDVPAGRLSTGNGDGGGPAEGTVEEQQVTVCAAGVVPR
jgi:hypothetical protein